MDLKGASEQLQNYDGWGKWEATQTVVLNAYADYVGDDSIARLDTSHELAPIDHFLI